MFVSIIIPTFNGEGTLAKCLDSCLSQTFQDIEIIVVNDGSRDRSRVVAEEFARKDSRIKVLNKENEGLVLARKSGLESASGDYVFFIDCDDYIDTSAIELLCAKCFDSEEGGLCAPDIIVGSMLLENSCGEFMSTVDNKLIFDQNNLIYDLLSKNLSTTISGRLLKRDLFQGVVFDKRYKIGEDGILMLQITRKQPTIAFVDVPLYHYVQYPNSMVNTANRNTALSRMEYMDYTYRFIKEWGAEDENLNEELLFDALAHFLLSEYYSFLRDGGKCEDNKTLTDFVFNQAFKSKWACSNTPAWRLLTLKMHRINPNLSKLFINLIAKIRKMRI